jgi:hypothetical protein
MTDRSYVHEDLKSRFIYQNALPFVVYGCEAWSLTVREERRLRVLEKRVLRRIFGTKRDEVTWGWRKQHNEELNDQYFPHNIVLVIQWRR